MTHPFHPLHGREFDLLESTTILGVAFVQYASDDGSVRSIRQAWTSAAPEDAFVKVAAGRSAFRMSDLLALAALLDGLGGDDGRGIEASDGTSTVKGILPHV